MADATIAARIAPELKADLEAVRASAGDETLTVTIRRLLRKAADVELGHPEELNAEHVPHGTPLMASTVPPAIRGQTTVDDHLAAPMPPMENPAVRDTPPRPGSQRRGALAFIADRGTEGATVDEVVHSFEAVYRAAGRKIAPASIARRVTDLAQADAIEPDFRADAPDKQRVRETRQGGEAVVYVVTEKGLEWLEATPTKELTA